MTEKQPSRDPIDEFDLGELAAMADRLGLYPVKPTRVTIVIETSEGDLWLVRVPPGADR